MFTKAQSEFLIRKLQRNEAALFVGAGFALPAKNRYGENLPTGKQLAAKIWKFIEMPGEYDDTPLATMYDLLLNKGIKTDDIKKFIIDIFSVKEFPAFLNNLSLPFWYKIYTTNIDNLLEKIYAESGQRAKILKFPKDEYLDVDRSLDSIQLIYLNGKIPCEPNELIFSKKQYARNQNGLQPLYHQFVNDYSTTTTIFLGTAIDEPIFEQYIAARETRTSSITEHRPQSFLIDPNISPARAQLLKQLYNIEPINATTEEFMTWLSENEESFGNKDETLQIIFPSYAELISKLSEKKVQDLGEYYNEFSNGFTKVSPFGEPKAKSKAFLLGASPSWNDIRNNLDAPRKITGEIFTKIEETILNDSRKIKVFALLGSAGSGKSTIIKRLALQLAQNGRTVFISHSEHTPKYESIVRTLNSFKEKVLLFFDNAELILSQLPNIIDALHACNNPPVILISTRTNIFDQLTSKLDPIVNLTEFKMPLLEKEEIIEIIKLLDQNNLLGYLKGLNPAERIKEFEYRSRKQILVAMREATNGEDFDKIIEREFDEISPPEAKFLTACVALTTEAGFTVSKQDFVGFSDVSPAETLHFLERNLSDVVIDVKAMIFKGPMILKSGPKQDRLILRHRAIADYIISNCLSVETLKKVYLRILSSLAPEINLNEWKSRKFALYREIINHGKIYNRFKNNINNARELYESLIPYFNSDYQFWLQYGSLELEGTSGSLELAENYLSQAASLKPNNLYVRNAMANLYFKKSVSIDTSAAITYREEANKLLLEILSDNKFDDPHTYHIYCKGNYDYIINKLSERLAIRKELEDLLKIIKRGLGNHPMNRRLKQINETIKKAHLLTAVEESVEFPPILGEFESK